MSQAVPLVFVVDDDVSIRESLELLLRHEGWQPETYASAPEFLAHPRVQTPNCLILDVSLPGLNGLDLQKRVAVERTEMPIIFLTGHRDVPMTVRAMKAGAQEFLTKPFNDEVLLAAIRQALERSRIALGREVEMQGLKRPLRVAHRSRTPGDGIGSLRQAKQARGQRTGYQRDHSEGSPRQGHGKDAGRLHRRPG